MGRGSWCRFRARLTRTETGVDILVVDDDRDIADIIGYSLRKDGHLAMLAHTGQEALDIDACRRDPDPVPLVGQQPAIGDVAVEGWSQDQEQDPHLVNFAPEMLGGQAVTEFVDDLHDCEAYPEAQDRPPVEEALEVGELVVERLPVADDQTQGHQHRQHAQRDVDALGRFTGHQPVEDVL